MNFYYFALLFIVSNFPKWHLPFLFLVVSRSEVGRAFLRIIVNLLSQEPFGLHPFLVHLLRTLAVLIGGVDVAKASVLGLFVDQVRAHKLESVGRGVALGPFFVVIVPNCALHVLVHRDKRVMPVEVNANHCRSVVVEEFSKLMNLHVLSYLFALHLYRVLLLQRERRLLLLLYLGQNRTVER